MFIMFLNEPYKIYRGFTNREFAITLSNEALLCVLVKENITQLSRIHNHFVQ